MKISLLDFFAVSLQRKLMLALVILVTLVMSAIGGYWLNSQRQTASAELEARATQMADLLAKTLSAPLWNLDLKSIHDQLDAVMADPAVFSAALYERGAATPLVYKDRPGQPVDAIQRQVTVWYVRERPAETVEVGTLRLVYTRYYIYQALGQTALLIAGLVLSLVLALTLVTYILLRRMVQSPVQELVALTGQIAGGDLQARIQVKSRDEIGQLARSCNQMAEQLQASHASLTALNRELEDKVASRTYELERRSAYLSASAEVAHTVASILDMDQLIRRLVDLIRQRFSLYYVGLFLVDETGEWALLRAGTGEAGRKMLARGHRIRVGSGMVGWSVAHGRPRIALEAGEDAVRLATPELPDTRSEAALPLRSRGRVLGALTIQSTQPNAFDEASLAVLQIMADQVAVALDNARLFAEAQMAVEAERRAHGEVGRQAWAQLLRARRGLGYVCDARGAVPVEDQVQPDMVQASQQGRTVQPDSATVVIPVKSREQIVGVARLRKPDGASAWTPDEIAMMEAVADQVGVALESARLYQDTQQRAVRERLISEATARMRETLDVETVLKTALDQVYQALGLDEVAIHLATGET